MGNTILEQHFFIHHWLLAISSLSWIHRVSPKMDRTGPLGLHYEISSFETWLASVAATVLSATMGVCLVVPGQTTHGCSLFEETWGHTKNLQILRFLGRWLEINNPSDRYIYIYVYIYICIYIYVQYIYIYIYVYICIYIYAQMRVKFLVLSIWRWRSEWMQHGDIYIYIPQAFRQLVFGFLAEEFGPHQSHHFLKCSVTLTLSICWEWRYLGKIKQVSENELVKQYQIVFFFPVSQSLTFWRPHLTLHCHSFVPRPVSLDSVTRLNETLLVSAAAPLVVRTCGLVAQLRCLKIGTHQVPWFDNLWSFSTFKLHKLAIFGCIPHPWTNPLKCLGHCHLAANLGQVDIDIFAGRVAVEDLRVGSPSGVTAWESYM